MTLEHTQRCFRNLLRAGSVRSLLSRDDHVGLENHALEHDAVLEELIEYRLQNGARDFLAALDRMSAVHQDFRLNDRHDVVFLAESRVARQGMSIGLDRECSRDPVADIDDGAPLGEARAELVILNQAFAQAVETFGNRLALELGQRLGTGIDLDAWDDALLRQIFRKRRAVLRLLTNGLVVQDHAADVVRGARRREEQFAVGAAILLRGFDLDAVEPLRDGAGALIRRQNALVLGHHCLGNASELTLVHRSNLRLGALRALKNTKLAPTEGLTLPGQSRRLPGQDTGGPWNGTESVLN